MGKHRVSFEFDTTDDRPEKWDWENLILIDDETDSVDWGSFRLERA